MTEPQWLWIEGIYVLHVRQINKFGGASGTRDTGLLESALGRPQNAFAYGEPDIAELAALYCIGIVMNHPFVDGNKRTGFMAMYTFLRLNGHEFSAGEADVIQHVRSLAAGEEKDADFIDWVRLNVTPAT